MAATSVNKLVESFENPIIPPIYSEPTYATIHSLHEILNANASFVSTNHGCVTLVHLWLTLSVTVFATLLATLVVPPNNTGASHVIPVGYT